MMRIGFFLSAICVGVFVFPAALYAQDEPPAIFRNEISLGLGVAMPSEQDPLNVPGEEKLSSSFAFSFLYRYHMNGRFAIGVHMYGYDCKTPTYAVQKIGETATQNLSFTLVSLNLGAQIRYTFLDGTFKPYVYAMVNYVGGSVQNDQTGTLNQSGFSAGGGAGVAWMISDNFALSLEGLASFGNANWKQKPFENSTGTGYDPSMVGVLLYISYFWGE